MKRLSFVILFFVWSLSSIAQPAGYYHSAEGLTGNQLKSALHNIIKDHSSISYAQIWNAFWSTDNKGNGIVWDMYSDRPNGNPPYTFHLGNDQCGNYSGEGDCYNREHSWPQSWFNDQTTPRTDLHHIFPTDGYVNNRRSNYPFGEVRSASWTSQNGSKLGTSKTPGYSGTVFEPIDEYKGDFARALFYMSVRYYGEDSGWKSSDMTNKSELKSWAIDMLLRWNELDPVSQKEIDRNNTIYNDYQHNRNPFIDNPDYANMIWDPNWTGTSHTIVASADAHGSITPSGNVTVDYGQNVTFTITPDQGYVVSDVKVDGVSKGALSTYTFSNVTAGHTIRASFVVSGTSTLEISDSEPYFYPNPVRRGGTLTFKKQNQEVNNLVICDLSGRTMLKMCVTNEVDYTLTLPKDLQAGFYCLRLMNGRQVVVNMKLVVK